jgi:hypothetical protein
LSDQSYGIPDGPAVTAQTRRQRVVVLREIGQQLHPVRCEIRGIPLQATDQYQPFGVAAGLLESYCPRVVEKLLLGPCQLRVHRCAEVGFERQIRAADAGTAHGEMNPVVVEQGAQDAVLDVVQGQALAGYADHFIVPGARG